MSKLKEQATAILATALILGALLGGHAAYVHLKVLPAQRAELESLRLAQAEELERNAAETRREIAAVNQLLKDALSARPGAGGALFASPEELAAAEQEQREKLAAAVAEKLHPYQPVPRTPEEAEALRNAQIDQVSDRLSGRIQPILGQIAADQNLTRESLDRYAERISREVSGVLAGELERNEDLGTQVQLTQSLAQESIALSHELTALYLSSIKDQGVINRLLLLPANIVRDASRLSLLNNEERRDKEAELTKRLRDIQARLDAARGATDATLATGGSASPSTSASGTATTDAGAATTGTGSLQVVVEESSASSRRVAPTRPDTTR